MFRIYDGRDHFWQWDLNQKLIVEDPTINEVHFNNRADKDSLPVEVYEENGLRVANVPNILLQEDLKIKVYGYSVDHTKHEAWFYVTTKSKPADYVYTETEVLNYNTLADRIDNVNGNISASVEDYLTRNPVEVDLSNYALKSEIPTNVSAFTNDAGYLTEHQDLSGYALKSEIPDVSGFLTKVPDEYITETELDAKGYLTEHQSLAGYAKLTDIPDVSGYALKSEIPDVSGYALKSEIPDVSSYQTANQVNALIDAKLGVIENGSY